MTKLTRTSFPMVERGESNTNSDLLHTSQISDLALRKPRKLWAKIASISVSGGHVNWLSTGDSLAPRKFQELAYNLDRKLGGIASEDNVFGNNPSLRAGDQLYTTDLSGVTTVTTGHDISPNGFYHNFASGGSLRLINGGHNLRRYTTVRVFYVKEPSAGSVALVVDGTTVVSASAAAASVSLGVLEYTITEPFETVTNTHIISVSGGSVKVLGSHFVNDTVDGVVKWQFLAAGGKRPDEFVETANSISIYEDLLDFIKPDMITFEMDDNFGDDGSNDAALNTILGLWDSHAPNADKLLIASTPRAADDEGKFKSNIALRTQAGIRGAAYLFFDSYTLMGSYADMVGIFGTDDGTHPNATAQVYAAAILWDYLGLEAASVGFSTRPVKAPSDVSTFSKGTIFNGPTGDLVLDADDGLSYDWYAKVFRSFAVHDEDGNVIFRASNQTAQATNILPKKINFGSDTEGKGLSFTDSIYGNLIVFTDTENDTGFSDLKARIFRPHIFTVATLPDFANVRRGALLYCDDSGVGGTGEYLFADGTGTKWKRVSDGTVAH